PAWRRAGAEPLDLTAACQRLADGGYGYGPAFRGLTSAWRRGASLFAEVNLDDRAGYGVHPALLDAALHPIVLSGLRAGATGQTIALPFSWTGARLHAAGGARLAGSPSADAPVVARGAPFATPPPPPPRPARPATHPPPPPPP